MTARPTTLIFNKCTTCDVSCQHACCHQSASPYPSTIRLFGCPGACICHQFQLLARTYYLEKALFSSCRASMQDSCTSKTTMMSLTAAGSIERVCKGSKAKQTKLFTWSFSTFLAALCFAACDLAALALSLALFRSSWSCSNFFSAFFVGSTACTHVYF